MSNALNPGLNAPIPTGPYPDTSYPSQPLPGIRPARQLSHRNGPHGMNLAAQPDRTPHQRAPGRDIRGRILPGVKIPGAAPPFTPATSAIARAARVANLPAKLPPAIAQVLKDSGAKSGQTKAAIPTTPAPLGLPNAMSPFAIPAPGKV